MSFAYTPLAATATRLITQFGQTATLARTTSTNGTESDAGKGVRIEINEGDRRRMDGAFGGAPMASSKYLLSGGMAPQLGDRLTVGSDSIVLSVIDPIQPGDVTLAWQVLGAAG